MWLAEQVGRSVRRLHFLAKSKGISCASVSSGIHRFKVRQEEGLQLLGAQAHCTSISMKPRAKYKALQGQGSRQGVMVRAAWPQHKENHVWFLYRKPAVHAQKGPETENHGRMGSICTGTLNSRTPPPNPADLLGLYLSSRPFTHPPDGDFSNLQFPITPYFYASTVRKI